MTNAAALGIALVAGLGCGAALAAGQRVSLDVVATAYNATEAQTDGTPHVGAWGDRLDDHVQPGVRVIAVSQDLLRKGLRRGQRVTIHGLRGEFVVLDKMPKRWSNRIDIYMQGDVRAAKRWGRRKVKISWEERG